MLIGRLGLEPTRLRDPLEAARVLRLAMPLGLGILECWDGCFLVIFFSVLSSPLDEDEGACTGCLGPTFSLSLVPVSSSASVLAVETEYTDDELGDAGADIALPQEDAWLEARL